MKYISSNFHIVVQSATCKPFLQVLKDQIECVNELQFLYVNCNNPIRCWFQLSDILRELQDRRDRGLLLYFYIFKCRKECLQDGELKGSNSHKSFLEGSLQKERRLHQRHKPIVALLKKTVGGNLPV